MISAGGQFREVEKLAGQVTRVQEAYPDTLLVGSLGRSVVYNEVFGDPMYEYELRKQVLSDRVGREMTDIDVVGLPHDPDHDPKGQFEMDTYAFDNKLVSITKCGGEWVLRSAWCGYERSIQPEVLQPITGRTICGVECRVPPPETQLALMYIWGADRKKDRLAQSALSEAIKASSMDKVDPASLRPFYDLGAINRSCLSAKLKRVYHLLPEPLTLKISATVLPVKRSIELRFS